jgi:hypothetical protein
MRTFERLDKFDKAVVKANVRRFMAYAAAQWVEQRPIVVVVAPPAPEVKVKEYNTIPAQIEAYLRKHKRANNKQLAQGLGREQSSIKHATLVMTKRGDLVMEKVGPKEVWFTLPQNAPAPQIAA